MDQDMPGEDGFSGYDSPRGGPSGNAGGSGENLPPRNGNAVGSMETRVILTPLFPIRRNS